MHYNGQGVPQDYKEVVKWFKRSADAYNEETNYGTWSSDDLAAQTMLGYMYDQGQ